MSLADILGIEYPDWTEHAVCAQVDPELWFPEKGGSTREAKKICAGCPVRTQCLDYALAHGERFGIYGGHSERERREMPLPSRVCAYDACRATFTPERADQKCCSRECAHKRAVIRYDATRIRAAS